jgi:hypothetical protein
MASSWISFGPDLEPMASLARRQEGPPQARRDGLSVVGSSAEVTAKLAGAGGWCLLELSGGDDPPRAVHVNASTVRFVVDEPT